MQEPTIRLTIAIQTSKMSVSIPLSWSINRLKCLLRTLLSILQTNNFSLKSKNILLQSSTKVSQIEDNFLTVQLIQGQDIEFQAYYQHSIKRMLKNELNPSEFFVPVLSPEYCNMVNTVYKNKSKQQIPQNNSIFKKLFTLLIYGIVFNFFLGILQNTNINQFAILGALITVYLLLERQIRRIRNAEPLRQQQQNRREPENIRRRQHIRRQENAKVQFLQKNKQNNQRFKKDKQLIPTQQKKFKTQQKVQQSQKYNSQYQNKKHTFKLQSQQHQELYQQQQFYSQQQKNQPRQISRQYQQIEQKNYFLRGGRQINREKSQQQQSCERTEITKQQHILVEEKIVSNVKEKEEKKEKQNTRFSKIKRRLYSTGVCFIECTYCFFLSLFPNWRVQIHLQIHGLLLRHIQKRIAQI